MNVELPIDEFRGAYAFLSNYFTAPVRLNGIVFPTNEHAFAAMKTTDVTERARIAHMPAPGDAKRAGRRLALRPDWEAIKGDVMLAIVRAKFRQHPALAQRLLETGSRELIEGNNWGDREWGVDRKTGVGKNRLGQTLMHVREEFRRAEAPAAPSLLHGRSVSGYVHRPPR